MATLVAGRSGIPRTVHGLHALRGHGTPTVSCDRDFMRQDGSRSRYVQGELFDIPRLLGAIEREEADTIIHLAAMSHPTTVGRLSDHHGSRQHRRTVSVVEAARIAGVDRAGKISSESAYGNQPIASYPRVLQT